MAKRTINKILRKFRRFFIGKEDVFYERFFIENRKWNTPVPNEDEALRWEAISALIDEGVMIENNLNILDVGCGRGWLTNLLSKYGNVEGIEPVKGVVSYAKVLFPAIQFYHGTARTLLNKGLREYNLIVSSEVIEHVPYEKKDEFVNDLRNLMVNNGYLIITTPRKEALEVIAQGNQPVEDWLSEKDVLKLFASNGFEVLLKKFVSPAELRNKVDLYQAWLFRKL